MKEIIRYSVLSETRTTKPKRWRVRRRNVWREPEGRTNDRFALDSSQLVTVKNLPSSSPPSFPRFFGSEWLRDYRPTTVPDNRVPRAQIVNWLARRKTRRKKERERERTASLAYYSKVSSDFPRWRPANLWTLLLGEVIAIKHRKLAKLRCNLAGDVLPPHLHFEWRRVHVHVHTASDSRRLVYSAGVYVYVNPRVLPPFVVVETFRQFLQFARRFTRACACLAKYEHALACVCACTRTTS